ncbi:MAG: hypothetical protein WC455_22650 [Dehalococcoidia bacterium]|jgi:hypothetical protein
MARKPKQLTPCCLSPGEAEGGGRFYRVLRKFSSPLTAVEYQVDGVYPEDIALQSVVRYGLAELIKENG